MTGLERGFIQQPNSLKRVGKGILLFSLLFLFLSGPLWALKAPKKVTRKKPCPECYSVDQCLECHDEIDKTAFATSVHGKNACTSCHRDIYDLESHAEGEIPMGKVKCEYCHRDEFKDYNMSIDRPGYRTTATP